VSLFEGVNNYQQDAEKLKNVALSANSDFFGNTSWQNERLSRFWRDSEASLRRVEKMC
jgi:hypothetical protein